MFSRRNGSIVSACFLLGVPLIGACSSSDGTPSNCSTTNTGDEAGSTQTGDDATTGNDGALDSGADGALDSGADGGTTSSLGDASDGGDATTGDDGSPDSEADGGTTSSLGDASSGSDASSGGDGQVANDGAVSTNADGGLVAIGAGCIAALWGTYVQRADGVLMHVGGSENTIVDSDTGLPLTGITNVLDGDVHGCAALSDGSAKCWSIAAGYGNGQGQLGNGTTTSGSTVWRATAVLTAPSTRLMDVYRVANSMESGSNNTSCAITNAGELYCWGDLTYIANNGATLQTGYAQKMTVDGTTPLSGVDAVALGPRAACALREGTNGREVWCWGGGNAGEAGQGTTALTQYPTKVPGFANPQYVTMAVGESTYSATPCVLDGDRIRCWGDNTYGAAGVNSTTNPVLNPTPVVDSTGAALTGVVDEEPGCTSGIALTSDGTLWTWGNNSGSTGTKSVVDSGITNVVTIGYGGGCNLGSYRSVTADGLYHSGMTTVSVNCNAM